MDGGKPLNKTDNVKLDRLALRARPEGSPLMEQTWERLLFMHWPIDPQILRPLIPARLEIDLFDGKAWISVTPFFLSGLRPMAGPGIPGLTEFHELNVRTYVHCDGVPGVWFFSLYCSKKIPVMAARFMYSLNYVKARFKEDYDSSTIQYQMTKTGALPLRWKARWSPGVRLRDAEVDSLAFFLTERYCLYGSDGGKLIRGRIYHAPWELQDAELLEYKSNMVHAQNLPEPTSAPLLHYAERMHVEVWPPTTI